MTSRILSAAFASALLLGTAGGAFAASDSDQTQDYEAWLNGVTTSEATTIAEDVTGDPARQVTFDGGNGSGIYRVETRSPEKVSVVEVDAVSGAVVNVTSIAPSQVPPAPRSVPENS